MIDELDDPLERYALDHAFYMMTTEVTQGMFQDSMGYDSREGKPTTYGDGTNPPAYYASWDMAADFTNTLGALQGEQASLFLTGSGTNVVCN